MKLSLQLVTWNGAKYVPHLFASLRAQTYTDWTLHVLDNGSTDGTGGMLMQMIVKNNDDRRYFLQATLEQLQENSGFVGGHNRLFAQYHDVDVVLLLNQDMALEPDCIEHLVRFMEAHPRAAAVSPRLMRWDPATGERSNRIDTLGLALYRTGRVVDWMHGHAWEDGLCDVLPYRTAVLREEREECFVEVFGVSGAMPCFRVTALRGLPASSNIFDDHFFSYKEDVDLAWRLRWMGWKAYVLPHAVAYHDRTAAGPDGEGDHAAAKHWKTKSAFVRKYSYRNHWFTLIKNVPWSAAMLWFELKKLVYLLFREPAVVRFCWHNILLSAMWRARRVIRRTRRAHPIELARWMI